MKGISRYPAFPATNSALYSLFHKFVNNKLSDFMGSDMVFFQPFVNILETPDAFKIEFAAPGFEKQQFGLKVENNRLLVSAKQETGQANTLERYTRREFQVTSFERSFQIPESVNQNEITAVYFNGILEIRLLKSKQSKPLVRTIEIGG